MAVCAGKPPDLTARFAVFIWAARIRRRGARRRVDQAQTASGRKRGPGIFLNEGGTCIPRTWAFSCPRFDVRRQDMRALRRRRNCDRAQKPPGNLLYGRLFSKNQYVHETPRGFFCRRELVAGGTRMPVRCMESASRRASGWRHAFIRSKGAVPARAVQGEFVRFFRL